MTVLLMCHEYDPARRVWAHVVHDLGSRPKDVGRPGADRAGLVSSVYLSQYSRPQRTTILVGN